MVAGATTRVLGETSMPMQICIRYGGQLHCHYVPELTIPVSWKPPGPGPVNYPAFLSDAIIWNAVQGLVRNFGDNNVRQALESGLSEGLKAMQRHAGADVEIRASATHSAA